MRDANVRAWLLRPMTTMDALCDALDPIGASGARLLVHLAHRIAEGDSHAALATLCVGAST